MKKDLIIILCCLLGFAILIYGMNDTLNHPENYLTKNTFLLGQSMVHWPALAYNWTLVEDNENYIFGVIYVLCGYGFIVLMAFGIIRDTTKNN